ncbi:MAG: COG1361 S-layer family protein, partial [Nitrososphaerales archaeon]
MKRTVTILIVTLLITSLLPVGTIQPANAANPGNDFSSALDITSGRHTYTLTSGRHYFKLDIQIGQTISLKLKVPEGSSFDLTIYDPSEDEVASSTLPSDSDESILYVAKITGFHFVKVSGTRFSGSGTYELSVFVTEFKVTSVEWGTAASTLEVGPGDVGVPLSVTVRNSGDNAVTDLTGTLHLGEAFFNSTRGKTTVYHFSDQISPGKTGVFSFILNAGEDASVGSHTLKLTLDYRMMVGSQALKGTPVNVTVPVLLLGKVNLDVSTDTTNLTPGELNQIGLSFGNSGSGTASSIDTVLTMPVGLILSGSDNFIHFDKIAPGETVSRSITVQVSSTAAGSQAQIQLSITYRDAYGNIRTVIRSLGFKIEAERTLFKVAESVWTSIGSLVEVGPGDEGVTLNVKVQNLGENTVTGLQGTLYLKPPFEKTLEDNVVVSSYGGAVQPGQTANFNFVFNVEDDADVGRYILDMSLTYLVVKGNQYQRGEPINLTVPILLLGRVDITASSSVTVFKPDEPNRFTLSIMNRGTGDASAVDITITAPPTISLKETDSHIFLSSLKAGAVAQIEVSAFVPLSAAGTTLQFTVSTSYRDPYGTVRSASRVLGFTVEKLEEGADLKVVDMVWGSLGSAIEVGLGDRNVPLTMVIENLGVSPVTGILAELRLPSPFMNSTGGNIASGYYGDVIQPGGTANIQFTVDLADEG